MRRAAPTSDLRRGPRATARLAARALAGLVLVGLSACDGGGASREATLELAGGDARLHVRGGDAARIDAALAEMSAEAAAAEKDFHAWRPSALTRINAAFRAGQPAPAPETVRRLLAHSRTFAQSSDGLLDPTVGGLVELWGFHADAFPLSSPPPTKAAVGAWLAARPRLAQVTLAGETLASSNRQVQLDFNSIVEGDAAAHVAATLRRHNLRHARLEMGGDTLVLGEDGGDPWRVSLRDPYGGELGYILLADGEAFFTSGNYDKFRNSTSGGRWGHVLDPRTGMPARGAAATAVLTDDPVLADAASTALMVGGPSAFTRLVASMGVGCALMVTEENELLITTAMRARMHFAREPVPLAAPVAAGADCR
jgi:thiamine biosynthesis lipoprotein